jgi:hypothetical protein
MIEWQYYPKSDPLPTHLKAMLSVFQESVSSIASVSNGEPSSLSSDSVLSILAEPLLSMGYQVETSKRAQDKISVPVLFGRNGVIEKAFEADAYHSGNRTVLEVEAGRAVVNNAVLKDLFEACMMHDIDYAAIAVRRLYMKSRDFDIVNGWFETLYVSKRLSLPLKGLLLIGYYHVSNLESGIPLSSNGHKTAPISAREEQAADGPPEYRCNRRSRTFLLQPPDRNAVAAIVRDEQRAAI